MTPGGSRDGARPAAEISIRPVIAGDAESVARLARDLGHPQSPVEIVRRLDLLAAAPLHAVFAAESGGRVRGWIHAAISHALVHEPEAEIVSLVVEEASRGRGIGAALVEAAEVWARGRGLARIRVRCRVEREGAHRFYSREGFSRLKTQHVFVKPLRRA